MGLVDVAPVPGLDPERLSGWFQRADGHQVHQNALARAELRREVPKKEA